MSSASLLTRFLFSSVVVFLVVSELAYAGSPRQDNPTQEPDAPKRVIHMTVSDLQAAITTRVEPVYPAVAAWAGISGTVIVHILVNQKGDVISTTHLEGHPLLKNAAATAVRDWKFKPAEADGKPVKMDGMAAIKFPTANLQPALIAQDKDVDKAKAAVQAFPGSPEGYFWLGTAYELGEQNQDAVKAFSKAIELKPNYEEAYEELIKLYQGSKATADVLRTYQRAIENIPDSLKLLTGQASALSHANRYADSVEVMKRALDINPDDFNALLLLGWNYRELKRFDEAVATLNEALKISPNSPAALHNLGWSYYQMKRYDDAIATDQKIISLNTPYAEMNKVYRDMGLALLESNRTNESIDALNHAIEMKGDLANLYCALSAAYVRAARMDEALQALKKGVQERPKDGCICENLGSISMKMGKLQEAEAYFRKAIELSPDRILGYGNLAFLLEGQKKDAEAESVLRRGIKSVGDSGPLRVLLDSLLARTKRAASEAQFKEALRADPNSAPALNDYGYYLVERGERLNEAFEMIQRAVDAFPDNAAYLDSLGWAYFKLGRLEEAERCLKKALQGSYKSTAMYEHLGDIYEKQGRRELAAEMWQKALAFNPQADDINRLKLKLSAESPNKK